MRRLSETQLFRRDGEPVGDSTLTRLLDEEERRVLARKADEGYQAAITEERLQTPEAVTNRGAKP